VNPVVKVSRLLGRIQMLTVSAFSVFASATFLGAMLGSLIGGYLAQPADRVWIIGKLPLVSTRPYIAPGLLLGCLTLGCALAVWLFVPEVSSSTLFNHSNDSRQTNPAYITSVTVSNLENPDTPVVSEATRCLGSNVGLQDRVSDSMSKNSHQTLWKEPHFWYLNIVESVGPLGLLRRLHDI
jgi:MFS family permease